MSLTIGQHAEAAAVNFLKEQGVSILERNRRYKCGEIDIIAKDRTHTIFVEVKHRKSDAFGSASEQVTHSKQKKLILAASLWTQKKDPNMRENYRFDIIVVQIKPQQCTWIKDAFS